MTARQRLSSLEKSGVADLYLATLYIEIDIEIIDSFISIYLARTAGITSQTLIPDARFIRSQSVKIRSLTGSVGPRFGLADLDCKRFQRHKLRQHKVQLLRPRFLRPRFSQASILRPRFPGLDSCSHRRSYYTASQKRGKMFQCA